MNAILSSALPTVEGPIQVFGRSKPFLSCGPALAAAGYIEEEFFLSGQSSVYDWAAEEPGRLRCLSKPVEYKTRMLVWRPRDPRRFSGDLELTLLNSSLGYDLGGPIDPTEMVAAGDVWIGLTTKPVSAAALARWDHERYSSLSWPSPFDAEDRCAYPSIVPAYTFGPGSETVIQAMSHLFSTPETEDGLIWDVMNQLGLLLKGSGRDKVLPGFPCPRVFATGFSQSSQYLRTWIAAFHDQARTEDGRPLYDGYLAIGGPVMARMHQCASDVTLQDPRQRLKISDARIISLSSEGEIWMAHHTRQPDEIAPASGIVSYEVAGGSHFAAEVSSVGPSLISSQTPPTAAMQAMPEFSLQQAAAALLPPGTRLNDLPWKPIERGAFHNLKVWVRDGVTPPLGQPIITDCHGEIVRDVHGNALGGVRLPHIDLPLATYRGSLSEGGLGSVIGWSRPLTPSGNPSAPSTSAKDLHVFFEAAERLHRERWISQSDAVALNKSVTEYTRLVP